MVDRLDPLDAAHQRRVVMMDVLDELGLGVGRSRDEDGARIRHGFDHAMVKVLILGRMAAADRVRLVVKVTGGIVRMKDKLVGVGGVEMKKAGLAMVDPDHGVEM